MQASKRTKSLYRLRGTFLDNEATSFSPEWCLTSSSKNIHKRASKFAMGSGASMPMMRKQELPSKQLDTVRVSQRPSTVITTKGQ